MPQGVVVADEAGTVVFRNDVAQVFSEARHSDALVEAAIGELVNGALTGQAEARELDLFGPPRRSFVISATPLPSASGLGALAVIEDVTERRRLEAVRRDFVANISHELKTPVGALALLAETLLSEDEPAVTQRLAERIVTESFRVGRTIEDLLELSRIESGELRAASRCRSTWWWPKRSSASVPRPNRPESTSSCASPTVDSPFSAIGASSSRPSTTCSTTP